MRISLILLIRLREMPTKGKNFKNPGIDGPSVNSNLTLMYIFVLSFSEPGGRVAAFDVAAAAVVRARGRRGDVAAVLRGGERVLR